MVTGGTLFEELGFFYIGPIDGHNLEHLIPVLRNVRKDETPGPVLLHVVTTKGKGYEPAENAPDRGHALGKFDVVTGEQKKSKPKAPSYTSVFANSLIKEADRDEAIVALTAAMPSGTGLDKFAKAHPTRCFDVGIAEQHCVTFAAGLATEGLKPFAAIYSTFLQRAYDQGRARCRGPEAAGALRDRPRRPGRRRRPHACGQLRRHLSQHPAGLRRPGRGGRGGARPHGAHRSDDRRHAQRLPLPRAAKAPACRCRKRPRCWRSARGGSFARARRSRSSPSAPACRRHWARADELQTRGLSTTVADARFAKPLDEDLIRRLAREHEVLITIEEGSIGGFSAHVMHFLAMSGFLDSGLKIRPMILPDRFVAHGTPAGMYEDAGLTAHDIANTALSALGSNSATMTRRA